MDLFSLGDLGGILIGAMLVAALVLSISLGVDETSSFSLFLRRKLIKDKGSDHSGPRDARRPVSDVRAAPGSSKSNGKKRFE